MNPTTLIDSLVKPLASGFLVLAQVSNPGADNATLIATAEGDLKHALRQKLQWVVDLLWAVPGFKEQLDALYAEMLASPAPVLTGQDGDN